MFQWKVDKEDRNRRMDVLEAIEWIKEYSLGTSIGKRIYDVKEWLWMLEYGTLDGFSRS